MKTTDGYELKKHSYYHTRFGEQVILYNWAESEEGPIYIVRRFYEGEAMEARLYPSGHTEITCPYEHETEFDEVVTELFKDSPIFIVEEEYDKKAKEVLQLSVSIGFLKQSLNSLTIEERLFSSKMQDKRNELANKQKELDAVQSSIETSKERLNELTRKIYESEDRLTSLVSNSEEAVTISASELEELRKDSFKLSCLDAGGVDNWEWYDGSLKDFRERYPE